MSLTPEALTRLTTMLQMMIESELALGECPIYDRNQLEAAKELSRTTLSFTTALRSLTTEAQSKLYVLNNKITSSYFHYGLNDLPDETLSNILVRDCCDPIYDFKLDRAHELQLTCMRFKLILDTTPKCWSRITRCVNLDKRLQLRGEFDVIVDQNTHSNLINRCAGRIASLECMEDTPSEIYIRNWDIQSVKSMVIHGSGLLSRSWILPQLTSLECNHVPPPGLFPMLRHCALKTCYRSKDGTLKVTDNDSNTMNFLTTTPLLLSLSLSIRSSRSLMVNRPTIALHHLRHLCLTTYTKHMFESQLVSTLDVPNLENMQVTFDKYIELNWNQPSGPTKLSEALPLVKNLVLVTSDYLVPRAVKINLHRLHSDFSSLKRLEISGRFTIVEPGDDHHNGDGPTLNRLETVSCSYTSDAMQLLDWYKANGADLSRVELENWTEQEDGVDEMKEKLSTLFPNAILYCQ